MIYHQVLDHFIQSAIHNVMTSSMRKVGDTVRVYVSTGVGSQLSAPTTLSLALTRPDATVVTYSLNDLSVIEPGRYFRDVVCSIPGKWTYTITSTGEPAATSSGYFTVEQVSPLLTITVIDTSGSVVYGAKVSVTKIGRIQSISSGTTGPTGVAIIELPEYGASYSVEVDSTDHKFDSGLIVTASSSNTLLTVTGMKMVTKRSFELSTCRVYGSIFDLDGRPSSTSIEVEAIGADSVAMVHPYGVYSDLALVTMSKKTIKPDRDGYWAIDLVQGLRVVLSIPEVKYYRELTVPAQDSLRFSDIRESLLASGHGSTEAARR